MWFDYTRLLTLAWNTRVQTLKKKRFVWQTRLSRIIDLGCRTAWVWRGSGTRWNEGTLQQEENCLQWTEVWKAGLWRTLAGNRNTDTFDTDTTNSLWPRHTVYLRIYLVDEKRNEDVYIGGRLEEVFVPISVGPGHNRLKFVLAVRYLAYSWTNLQMDLQLVGLARHCHQRLYWSCQTHTLHKISE